MNYKYHILQLITNSKTTDQDAAEAMGISYGTFRLCKSESGSRNNFTKSHYDKLFAYLKIRGDKLMKLLQDTAMTNSELGKTKQ